MKRIISTLALSMAFAAMLCAQEYPFQDTKLSEEERLDNAVSLMTIEEKIGTITGQGVPRLGIANPGATEAIHGIVRGGDADLPNLGNAGQFGGGWPGRPTPKYTNSTAFPQAYGVGETWDRSMAWTVGDGGIDNPDAVALHLGDGHMNKVQFAIFPGCRRDGSIH